MTSGIYMIRHRESGKAYIGRSVDIELRWQQHRSDAKSGRTTNPIHAAIRKYGAEAFDWKVLLTVPARLQVFFETMFAVDWKTFAPLGYNIGGTEGGFPSTALMAEMPQAEQERWRDIYLSSGSKGQEALRELRKCPKFEASYREKKSAASSNREARMRERRAADPAYDEKIRVAKRAGSQAEHRRLNPQKAAETFKARWKDDPEFAARVRENRIKAAKTAWENRRAKVRAMTEVLRGADLS